MLAGMSESVALFVTVSVDNSAMVTLVCAGSAGALFTSVTTTMKLLVALMGGAPLSVAMVVSVFVLGPCASLGVQVITPLVSICAPAGGLTSVYESAFAGRSESVARLVTTSAANSATVMLF